MEDEFEFNGNFSINFDEVINSPKYSSILKFLAKQIQETQYISTGDFFRNLSDSDIQYLCDAIEDANVMEDDEYMEDERVDELLLLTMMLSQGEGGEEDSIEELQRKMNAFCALAITTSLSRKGLVDVFYENFSLQEDTENKVVAKRKDGVDYDSLLSDMDDD